MAPKVSDRTLDKILLYLTEKLSYNTIHKKLNEWKKESQNTKKHFELEKTTKKTECTSDQLLGLEKALEVTHLPSAWKN